MAGSTPSKLADIRVVLFDAVGTLFEPAVPVAKIYTHWGSRHGSKYETAEVAQRFKAALAADDARDASLRPLGETDEAWERYRWHQIVAHVFDDLSHVDELLDVLWEHFAQAASWQLTPGALDIWEWLTARGLQVGMASNFDARLTAICEAHAVPCGERLFVSSLVGFRKPAAGFFAAVQQALDCPPREIMLVGDSVENDFLPAQNTGWQAVLYDPQHKSQLEPRITNLADLKSLFE